MKFIVKPLVLVLAFALAFVQQPWWSQEADQGAGFSTAELEQLVAPVALYPDSLLMQVYMAATYPLEVVEAERWVSKNSNLSGDALDEAVKGYDWDISVKSLCHFPDILTRMADNLDWTRDVGDAFLDQEADLLDTTQRMRQKAYDEGHLKSGQEQTVTVQQDKIIVIESSSPEVIYVPSYNPTVVYGAGWYYPHWRYPSMYYYPPWAALFTFTAGMFVGAALWGNCHWGWGRSYANVNVNVYNNYNKRTNVNWNRTNISTGGGNRTKWQHKPEHRKGVDYKNRDTAKRYGGSGSGNRVTRDQARGYSENRGNRGQGDRAGTRQGADRGSAQQRPSQGTAKQRPSQGTAQQRPSQGTRQNQGSANRSSSQKSTRDGALSGAGKSSNLERSSSKRGSGSRAGTSGSKKSSGSSRSTGSGSKKRSSGGRKR